MTAPLWSPSPERVAGTNLASFVAALHAKGELPRTQGAAVDYDALYAWSVGHPERFWPVVWRFCGVVAEPREGAEPWDEVVVGLERMAPPDPELGPRWFTGARLNFAENLLRYRDDRPALVCWNERGRQREVRYAELYA